MARRNNNRNRQNYNYGGRETYEFSKQRLPLQKNIFKRSVPISDFEDRRHFHPEGPQRPAQTFRGIPARFKVKVQIRSKDNIPKLVESSYYSTGYEDVPHQMSFRNPDRVLVCARRQIRKEVLHALGISGRRGIGRGGVKFNENSKFGC